ncbi:MAG: hypothetical protein LBD58_04340 [Treponema sp.]|jgi:hypothetical protein|nr:hypothetical protein [Treponema sp.]
MNTTSIALDDFIAAFTAALDMANYKIAERHLAIQNEMKETYGPYIASIASCGQALHIKRGSVTVTAKPLLKKEAGADGKTDRLYLKFSGLNTREMRFEVALE